MNIAAMAGKWRGMVLGDEANTGFELKDEQGLSKRKHEGAGAIMKFYLSPRSL